MTRKRYNRDTPYKIEEIQTIISNHVMENHPIPLIGFWGVGPKDQPNGVDKATCEFLKQYDNDIKTIYPPGLSLQFIFSTLHGVQNGIARDIIDSYCRGMETIFQHYGFGWVYLDPLWQTYHISFEKINDAIHAKPTNWWESIENHDLIEANARAHNQRRPPQEAGQFYFVMRKMEKRMFQEEYGKHIFHTFSDRRLLNVLPDMPMLFLYARKGLVNTPWFVTE